MRNINIERVYALLKITTDNAFYEYASNMNAQCLAAHKPQATVKIVAADDNLNDYIVALEKKINLRQMSDSDLNSLYEQGVNGSTAPLSTKIILAASMEQVQTAGSHYLPQIGDTLILPNEVLQYGEDGRFHSLIQHTKMQKIFPTQLIPTQATQIRVLKSFSNLDYQDSEEKEKMEASLLTNALHVSPHKKIIRTSSLDKIQEKNIVLESGDTIILPNQVVCYEENDRFKIILDQSTMQTAIPPRYIPDECDECYGVNVLISRSAEEQAQDKQDHLDALTLTQALNTSLQKNADAFYVSEEFIQYQGSVLLAAVTWVTEQEINRRKLVNNLILKVMVCKDDVAFMQYWERIKPGEELREEALRAHVADALQTHKRIDLSSLSDNDLQTLHEQCDIWVPTLSSRIIFAAQFPKDYHLNDTVILPDGVYQMCVNKEGKHKKQRIMDAEALRGSGLLDKLPKPIPKQAIIYDNYTKPPASALVKHLNTLIGRHSKGIYLSPPIERSSQSCLVISSVLQEKAEQELEKRAAQQVQAKPTSSMLSSLWGLWGLFTWNKVAPATPAAIAAAPKMTTAQLRTQAQDLKKSQTAEPYVPQTTVHDLMISTHLSKTHPRKFPDLQNAIQEVIKELEVSSGEENYKPQENNKDNTITIVNSANQKPLLKAGIKSLIVYKPLLEAKIAQYPTEDFEKKAELFLNTLGIPPANGKRLNNIRGGNHGLRKAIRAKFEEYKELECSQFLENRQSFYSDSDADSVTNSKRSK